MKSASPREAKEILAAISKDRLRTNLFKNSEQKVLVYLVQRIPPSFQPDMLTLIGLLGSLIILLSFILAAFINRHYLLLGVLGFMINWFGDSLDGRIAYFRNKPRKWYGFSLDLIIDWMSTILIGTGYLIYAEGLWELAGFAFVVMYGWAIIIAVIRYHITGKYTIDSGLVGPTEIRIIISVIIIAEIFVKNILLYSAAIISAVLLVVNIFDTYKLLKLANDRDHSENEKIFITK